jgi:WD40 repeat protein/tetratricopeptide (TPR) repeat protein
MSAAPRKRNPFPGLRPFNQEEDYLFFGREEQTLELLSRLANHRLVAVVGSSGSGKSSLVRCGLLSELLGGRMLEAGAAWQIAVTHPGGNPLAILTDALLEADLYDRDAEHARENLLATLSRSHFGLVEAVKQADLGGDTNFLLVVDQFEEIFRFHEAGQTQQEAANEFVSLLLEAVAQKAVPIYVVLTMRSDFIGECGQFEGLAEMVNRGEFLIPRLTREQYKRVIEGPIKVAGGKIAPRLLQRLLNDLGQQADQLPCLQHALMRTWDVWSARARTDALDLDDYQSVGRMSQALSLHADEIYESFATERQRELCKGLFQALTVQESNSRGIRRPQRLGRLGQILEVATAELHPIIDAYRQSGVTFLMPSPETVLTDQTIIDISHESLMRVWTRLRQWVDEETQAAGIYHRLSESAALHEEGKAGLYRDPELGIALAWRDAKRPNAAWAERYRPGFDSAIGFLEASQQASVAEDQARDAARQRELEQAQQLAEAQQLRLEQQHRAARKLRAVIAGLAAVVVIAVLACVAALVANQRAVKLAITARTNELTAKENAKRAKQSQSETESALLVAKSQKGKAEAAERAARIAEESGRTLLYTTDMRLAPFVWKDDRSTSDQLRALLAKHVPEETTSEAGEHGGPSSAPGLASVATKRDLRGFEWYYYQNLLQTNATVYAGDGAPVVASALAPDGALMTLDLNGRLRRWNADSQAEDPARRRVLPGCRTADARAVSADGRLVALADGGMVRVYEADTGDERFAVDWDLNSSRDFILSARGEWLVIVDNKVRWFNAATGDLAASMSLRFGRVESLALSENGLTLTVVGHGGIGNLATVLRLDEATKTVAIKVRDLNFGFGTLKASAMTLDGARLAIAAKLSGSVGVFDVAAAKQIAIHKAAHASPITAMTFTRNGAGLATADAEGTIKIWADAEKFYPTPVGTQMLKGHQGAISTIAFSDDGKRLVTASADRTARVWDLETVGAAVRQLENAPSGSWVVRFSPDGQLIAGANGDRVRLWDAATGRVVRELRAGDPVVSVAFSPTDPRLLAVGFRGNPTASPVALWDLDAATELARLTGTVDLPGFPEDTAAEPVSALAFSPDGKYLVAGFGMKNLYSATSYPNPLKVWEVATRRLVRRLNGHTRFCVAVDFSRDGSLLASAGHDGKAIVWSTETWRPVHTLMNRDRGTLDTDSGRAQVQDVAFSPDGKTLAMASYGGSVQLWDVVTGKLLESLKGHSNAVGAVAFSPDGRTLASGGGDRTVRLWNVATRRELMQLDPGRMTLGDVRSLAFSPDGRQLLAGDGSTGFWFAAPIVWNDPARAADSLRKLLRSDADFKSRIRMLSENLRLHEALGRLDPNERRVQAALAATQANWHASRQAWPESAAAFDRLVAADPGPQRQWLRVTGLLRVATALVHQGRPADAAALLTGGPQRRAVDAVSDPETGALLDPLRTLVNERLAKDTQNAGLLELRAELAGQWAETKAQVADYTAAIESLGRQKTDSAAAALKRLYRRRADAYVNLKKWPEALADYARIVTDATTDEELRTNHVRAIVGARQAATPWTVLKPIETRSDLGATFSIRPDGSILVGGANRFKERYHVVFTVPADMKLLALRLEALTDDSLPNRGPGRSPTGTFAQNFWNVTAMPKGAHVPVALQFDNAWAEHQLEGFPINKFGHWNIEGYQGLDATAIWVMARPISLAAGSTLTCEMQCQTYYDDNQNLGRFRLSATGDPAAIASERLRVVAAKLTDPRQTLAVHYLIEGDTQASDRLLKQNPKLAGPVGDIFTQYPELNWQRAIDVYSKGITSETPDGGILARRARAYEAIKDWEAASADWSRAADQLPDGAKLLAEFGRRLVAGGQRSLSKAPFEKSRALHERALEADPGNDLIAAELARVLMDLYDGALAARWKALAPTAMKSAGGGTLKVQPDGSILASGTNPEFDDYTIVATPDLERITAIRLEALPDPSLPLGGPGRAPQTGNFQLNEWRVFSAGKPCTLSAIVAAQSDGTRASKAIDGKVDQDVGWANHSRPGAASFAVVSTRLSRARRDEMRIELHFSRAQGGGQNLGRFRLSVSDDPTIFAQEDRHLAAYTPADHWLKLAAAYAAIGQTDRASKYFVRALQEAESYDVRTPIVELAARFEPVLEALLAQRPDDPQLQLALARKLAGRGAQSVRENQFAEGRIDLERARAILMRIRGRLPRPVWTVLKPTQLRSARGQTLTLLGDDSILASGENPDQDTYTITAPVGPGVITGLRLETIPDDRQKGDASRFWGEFFLSEIDLALQPAEGGPGGGPAIKDGSADFSRIDHPVSYAFDRDESTAWGTHPRIGEPHTAVFACDASSAAGVGSRQLTVRLESGSSMYPHRNLGRFRLSVSDQGGDLLTAFKVRDESHERELVDLNITLAKAYANEANTSAAVASLIEALALAADRAGKARVVAEAATLEGVLAQLAERPSDDGLFQAELARHFAAHGDTQRADTARSRAGLLLEQKLAREPENASWPTELVDLLLPSITSKANPIVPTSEKKGVGWRFSTNEPPANWVDARFDDSKWISGPGAFGAKGAAAGPPIGTEWTTRRIWLRRTFEWKPDPTVRSLLLRAIHDDGIEVFLNGRRLFAKPEFNPAYAFYALDPNTLSLLKPGTNTIAVHAFSGFGDQYVDLGLLGLTADARTVQHAVAAMKISDAWARLAATYRIVGDEAALSRLLAHHPSAARGLGELYAADHDWERSLADYNRAITPDCKDATLFAARAEVHEKLGHLELAAADWWNADRNAVDKATRYGNPSLPALEQRARIHGRLQQIDRQIADYNELLKPERLGDHPSIFARRAEAYSLLRQWEKARADFDRAIDVAPSDARGAYYFDRARLVYAPRAEWKRALKDLRRFYRRPADFHDGAWPSTELWALHDAAFICAVAGDVESYARAVAECEPRLAAGTLDAGETRWTVLAMLLFPEMITRDSRQRLLDASGKTDDFWRPRLTAAIHFRSGDFKKAAELFDASADLSYFHFLAAMAHEKAGNHDRAQALLDEGNRWLRDETRKDPGSGVPKQLGWRDWAETTTLQYEASDLIVGAAARPNGLPERAVGEARFQTALARHLAERGNVPNASAARAKARALYEQRLRAEPHSLPLANELGDLLWSTLPPVETFWMDDAAPPGAYLQGDTRWEFVGKPDHPVFRGVRSTRRQAVRTSQHYFEQVTPRLKIGAGSRLFAYIYLDPKNPPKTVMLQFGAGENTDWDHRAYWGQDEIPFGRGNRESHFPAGPLPKAGEWVRLEVDAAAVGLPAGSELSAWAFTQFGGTCYWDAAGVTNSFEGPWQRLAAAYHRLGDQPALDALLVQHPEAVSGIGDLHAAAHDWEPAIEAYRKRAADPRVDGTFLLKLAAAYQAAGRTREAVPYLAQASAANPKDSLLSLRVAALQAWFGQEQELAATRQRIRTLAQKTGDSIVAERAAKACSIVPRSSKAEQEAALALARAGIALDKSSRLGAWNLLSLGMAEYRAGDDDAAERALISAAQAGPDNPHVTGISAFYRAMGLFRQGKKEQAREIAKAAAAEMLPLPADEQNPLANLNATPPGGDVLEYLILWLAYKEANAMIHFTESTTPAQK